MFQLGPPSQKIKVNSCLFIICRYSILHEPRTWWNPMWPTWCNRTWPLHLVVETVLHMQILVRFLNRQKWHSHAYFWIIRKGQQISMSKKMRVSGIIFWDNWFPSWAHPLHSRLLEDDVVDLEVVDSNFIPASQSLRPVDADSGT